GSSTSGCGAGSARAPGSARPSRPPPRTSRPPTSAPPVRSCRLPRPAPTSRRASDRQVPARRSAEALDGEGRGRRELADGGVLLLVAEQLTERTAGDERAVGQDVHGPARALDE